MKKKDRETEENVVEAESQNTSMEVTPYDTMYNQGKNGNKNEQKEDGQNKLINLSFSVNSLSNILCLASLFLTFIYAVLTCFGVGFLNFNFSGVFFLITSLLAIAGLVFAYANCKNKMNMPLAFATFTILITVIVYL